ncbi:MAG: DUF4105 domain-containing protein [Balneolaceae bacterium]|nr:DUF4105 domain-containing protein [Balneolaceae bacterium]
MHVVYPSKINQIAVFLLSITFLCIKHDVNAQGVQLSEDAQISLITILPGDAPEELFGHSAIRIQDLQNNIDLSYNYGTFHFDAFFLPKFIYGDLEYFLSVANYSASRRYYLEQQRPIIEQVLNLTLSQKQDVFEFLRVNALEENRYYQYDFLYDNCSTRIRDLFEHVLGDDLRFSPEVASGFTFRDMIHLYVHQRPFIQLGMDLLLGNRVDQIITTRETMFLPDFLMKEFDRATMLVNGEIQPFVASTELPSHFPDEISRAGQPWALLLTWALFLAGAVITYKNYRNSKTIVRWFDLPLFTVTGLIGLLILFLWFISLHEVTINNLNMLWAWPTHIFIIPFLFRRLNSVLPLATYLSLLIISCLIILIGWTFWTQHLHPAILPILLLLITRSGWIVLRVKNGASKVKREN